MNPNDALLTDYLGHKLGGKIEMRLDMAALSALDVTLPGMETLTFADMVDENNLDSVTMSFPRGMPSMEEIGDVIQEYYRAVGYTIEIKHHEPCCIALVSGPDGLHLFVMAVLLSPTMLHIMANGVDRNTHLPALE